MLIDGHGRVIDYVRIAVTDKCNLRCFYCMPDEGIKFSKNDQLLTYEEIHRLVKILGSAGVRKVRITGGEPFLRKNITSLFQMLSEVPEIDNLSVTTNGTLTEKYIPELLSLGVRNYNLSLDSLDKKRFYDITRRDQFDIVWSCLQSLLDVDCTVKINAVVMPDRNIEDLIPMADLTKDQQIEMRFIEEMPFNGDGSFDQKLIWNHKRILDHLTEKFGSLEKIEDPKGATSIQYKIPDYKGTIGIIPAYSRTFCGSCNRLRITPTGMLKSCLYDGGVFNLRDLIRHGATDDEVLFAIQNAIHDKALDGFEAEKNRIHSRIVESMATIGG